MPWLKRRGESSVTPYPLGLNHPLLWLSKRDPFLLKHAFTHVLAIGASGAGKTTGSGQFLAKNAYLRAGFGGCVLVYKEDETQRWVQWAAETGRLDDLVIVNPDNPWRFNFLDYQFSRAGEGAGYTENAVNILMELVENRYDGGKRTERDSFWTDNVRRLLRFSMDVIRAAGYPVTMARIKAIVDGRPSPNPATGELRWPPGSFLQQCLFEAERLGEDVSQARIFFERELCVFGAEKQAAGIISTFTSMADPLLSGPLSELFCADTNFTPEWSRFGKIIIIDLPTLQYESVGRLGALLFKAVWQAEMLRRQGLPHGERPVFLYADESQEFFSKLDSRFLEASRSSWCSVFYLTQSLSAYYRVLEAERGHDIANAMLANFGTTFFHRTGDKVSNEWAASTISKALTIRYSGGWSTSESENYGEGTSIGRNASSGRNFSENNWSFSTSRGSNSGYSQNWGRSAQQGENASWREEMDFQVQPELFTRLASGGAEFNYQVQAVVFQPGTRFSTTGKPYMGVTFPQFEGITPRKRGFWR